VTTPEDEPTVAKLVLLLLQVPPGGLSLRVIEDPWQTALGPESVGVGLTVTVTVAEGQAVIE